ncbi:MAG: hypothetical protein K2G55_07475 [Lachnospiraceae bacterium]|nr:hypothetical protein [Lachnospiraceae bacterium]MDE7205093.1 hypothetical protein [Lachnospiraceae bacterium]
MSRSLKEGIYDAPERFYNGFVLGLWSLLTEKSTVLNVHKPLKEQNLEEARLVS